MENKLKNARKVKRIKKIIIELREFLDGVKIDNSKTIQEIIKYCNKYWNCQSIGVY